MMAIRCTSLPQVFKTDHFRSAFHVNIQPFPPAALGYKPFRCTLCQKEFLTGYLLKKHMDVHVSERRYKCGECGKLYKTIGHVREHMRAHSDERPYHCTKCNKGYKTKVSAWARLMNCIFIHPLGQIAIYGYDPIKSILEACLMSRWRFGQLAQECLHEEFGVRTQYLFIGGYHQNTLNSRPAHKK